MDNELKVIKFSDKTISIIDSEIEKGAPVEIVRDALADLKDIFEDDYKGLHEISGIISSHYKIRKYILEKELKKEYDPILTPEYDPIAAASIRHQIIKMGKEFAKDKYSQADGEQAFEDLEESLKGFSLFYFQIFMTLYANSLCPQ
jgi:hypothetical protein